MSKTYSRYDYMEEGTTQDSILGSNYPDPLTLNYNELNLTSIPKNDDVSSQDIIYFWREAEDMYGIASYDDMVLTLNGIPHKNFLSAGHKVYFPTIDDMESSFQKGR
jgi:hypothetical protein